MSILMYREPGCLNVWMSGQIHSASHARRVHDTAFRDDLDDRGSNLWAATSGYDPIGMFYDVRCPKHCTIGLHISPILRQVQSIVNSTITLLLLRSTLVYDC